MQFGLNLKAEFIHRNIQKIYVSDVSIATLLSYTIYISSIHKAFRVPAVHI